MSTATLEPLNQTIALPGCRLTPTSLEFTGDPSDEDMAAIGLTLQRMEGCKAWWWGDFLVKQEERHGEHYTQQYAELAGLEQQSLRRYKMVAKFFKPLHRCNDLSWTHHLEAMLANTTSVKEGQQWLEKAQEEKLPVPKLRSAIRKAKRDPKLDDSTKPPSESYSEALAFNRWSRTMLPKVETFSKERAQAVLEDLKEAIAFLEAVRLKAG